MQQPHRHGRPVQCREEESRCLLLYSHLLLPLQMPSLRWLVRNSNRPQGEFARNDSGRPVVLTFAQNTRYVVVSGARQKDEEWDPEENGGFAIHGT